jgi:hypothetical protein
MTDDARNLVLRPSGHNTEDMDDKRIITASAVADFEDTFGHYERPDATGLRVRATITAKADDCIFHGRTSKGH